MDDATIHATETLTVRRFARGQGWSVSDVVCRAGPDDPRFEERHGGVSIAAVIEGSFLYRNGAGDALLSPGTVMLGNAGSCFECGHEHGVGDRCIAFHYEPETFAEIAASVAGDHRFAFPAPMLPQTAALLRPLVVAEAQARADARRRDPAAMDELAVVVAERVIETVAGVRGGGTAPSARDAKRISAVVRHIEGQADAPGDQGIDLDALAALACMSKYHFLRTFRRIVGVTPYRFTLDLRLRRAAVALRTTREPVAAIAFGAGFGDLSTFNHRFRAAFGAAPTAFRNA